MFSGLKEDIDAILARDPAARSRWEVVLCYPGFHALVWHRLAHRAWSARLYLLGRFLSHLGRVLTGIEIHPAAKIGRRVFIDHGMGVVIGSTAEVGDDVTLYQGVTLGGTSLDRDAKRHPTIEQGVIVGSGAAILGPFTVGRDARVGANAVVLSAVAPGETVVGIPARSTAAAVRAKGATPLIPRSPPFLPYGTPDEAQCDGLAQEVLQLRGQIAALEARLDAMAAAAPVTGFETARRQGHG